MARSSESGPPGLPSLPEIEKRLGLPAEQWKGHCHEIAALISDVFDIDCRLCYGHWHGTVVTESPLYRAWAPFARHGWLELPDGRVYDPTRWVFEGKEPYVYVGPNDFYDEGGDALRQALESVKPVPGPDADPRKVPLRITDLGARDFVAKIFDTVPEDLNLHQVFYLANLSRRTLGAHILPIYRAIVDAGQGMAIPIDNQLLVLGVGKARKGRKKNNKGQGPTLFPGMGPYEEGF